MSECQHPWPGTEKRTEKIGFRWGKKGGSQQGGEERRMMKNKASARVGCHWPQKYLSPSPPRLGWTEAKTKGELKRCFASHYTDS